MKETELKLNHIYLLENRSFTSYSNIFEWELVGISHTSYKFEDKITGRIFWLDRKQINFDDNWGRDGYFVKECICQPIELDWSKLAK